MNVFYVIFLVIIIILLGQWNPKIGLAVAGLIFLGSLLYNGSDLVNTLKGEFGL